MWLSIAVDIIVLSFTDNAANPFKELVIVINGKVHSDASNLVEGDTLYVVFRSVGLKEFRASPTCAYLQYHTQKRAGCRYGGNMCNTPNVGIEGFAYVYYFQPVELSDNGTVIAITIAGDVVYEVTIFGKC